jgi:hypothetical protein
LPSLHSVLGRAPAATPAPSSPAPPAPSAPSSLPPATAPAEPGVLRPPTDDSLAPTSPPPRPAGSASILIFSPRPGSIATGRPTELCYAVSDALEARVDPGVGEVTPANTLTCLRVAPARTTTYELTAYGRNGLPVKQQLVIIVR